MGKIICERHGEQGIVHACDHVRQDVPTGSVTIDCVVTAKEVIGDFGKEPIAFTVAYCDKCATQYGLSLHDGVLPDSASEFVDQTKPICSECFNALKESLRSCESG